MTTRQLTERRVSDRRRAQAHLSVGASAPRRLATGFAVVLVLLGTAHALATMPPGGIDLPGRSLLDLGAERTLGTWVNSALHAMCAVIASIGALLTRQRARRWVRNWWLLAAAFAAMSVDEVATVHDRVREPLQEALELTGVFYYAWVIPALVLVCVFVIVQARFFLHGLTRSTARGLLIAGVVFVIAAVGLEMAEGWLHSNGRLESTLFSLLILTEEVVEIGATMAAACILLRHILREFGEVRITFTRSLPSE